MLSKIYKGLLAIVALIAGVLALVLGIQTQRAKRLKAEAIGAKKDAAKAAEQLEVVNHAVSKAEEKRKNVLKTEATIDNIKKEAAAAVEQAKEIKAKDTIRFGKWVLIFAIMFAPTGCGYTLSECRAAYPCPDNVCIEVTPPKLETLQRPELAELAVSYNEAAKGFVLSPEQIGVLLGNERALIETIKGYEKTIDAYNEWRLRR